MSEWIRVEDAVPESKPEPKDLWLNEPSEEVLVFSKNTGVRIGYYHRGKMHVSCSYCDEDAVVTHWMPLPESPAPYATK